MEGLNKTIWISVNDRLPRIKNFLGYWDDGKVTLFGDDDDYEYGLSGVQSELDTIVTTKLTHWQPLPEPPTDEK